MAKPKKKPLDFLKNAKVIPITRVPYKDLKATLNRLDPDRLKKN